MSQTIPATQERYGDILSAVILAVNNGGKFISIINENDLLASRKATADERNAQQRALNWVWNKEIAAQTGHDVRYIHGLYKYTYLQPLYKSWGGEFLRRSEHLDAVFESLLDFNTRILVAYDMVRTRTLSVAKMAEYLSEIQRNAANDGIQLTSNSDLEFKSLMVQAENR